MNHTIESKKPLNWVMELPIPSWTIEIDTEDIPTLKLYLQENFDFLIEEWFLGEWFQKDDLEDPIKLLIALSRITRVITSKAKEISDIAVEKHKERIEEILRYKEELKKVEQNISNTDNAIQDHNARKWHLEDKIKKISDEIQKLKSEIKELEEKNKTWSDDTNVILIVWADKIKNTIWKKQNNISKKRELLQRHKLELVDLDKSLTVIQDSHEKLLEAKETLELNIGLFPDIEES